LITNLKIKGEFSLYFLVYGDFATFLSSSQLRQWALSNQKDSEFMCGGAGSGRAGSSAGQGWMKREGRSGGDRKTQWEIPRTVF